MKQLVSDPTRGEYLLDIVLLDVGDMTKVSVLPSLADHRVVRMDMNIVIARTTNASREVWDIRHADWDGLKSAITLSRWGDFLCESSFDSSVDGFCNHLCEISARFIPKKMISNNQNPHTWLDDECFSAIEAKCLATNSCEFFRETTLLCRSLIA